MDFIALMVVILFDGGILMFFWREILEGMEKIVGMIFLAIAFPFILLKELLEELIGSPAKEPTESQKAIWESRVNGYHG